MTDRTKALRANIGGPGKRYVKRPAVVPVAPTVADWSPRVTCTECTQPQHVGHQCVPSAAERTRACGCAVRLETVQIDDRGVFRAAVPCRHTGANT
jgi:hypothetical protein